MFAPASDQARTSPANLAIDYAKGWAAKKLFGLPAIITVTVVVMSMVMTARILNQENFGAGESTILPSAYAQTLIPPQMLALYRSQLVQRQCPTLPWPYIAAIGHIESNDGRDAVTSSKGAMGVSQFEPTTWDHAGKLIVNVGKPYGEVPSGEGYGVDGDGDGKANINDPQDSLPATARLLCANGGGNPATLPQAIFAYNHAGWYVDEVMSLAHKLAGSPLTVAPLPGAPSVGVRAAVGFAVSQTGEPYTFGGSSPQTGFDCSGLIAWAFQQAGYNFGRPNAAGEFNWGIHVPFSQIQEGDLIFWATPDGYIDHVAMYVGNGLMIVARHSGTKVGLQKFWRVSGDLHFAGITRVVTPPTRPTSPVFDHPGGGE